MSPAPQSEIHRLSGILTLAKPLVAREGDRDLYLQLLDLSERISGNEFRICIVGQFKRGKTSLLNALLHAPGLLPTGTLPSTSVLTTVRYGDTKNAQVIFRSGEHRSIALTELKDYVTESGNPDNHKKVDRVEVYHAGDILREGIIFINCPGFGSLSDRNTQIANDCILQTDAAVFVTSPDPPITRVEVEFLRKLTLAHKKIFVVMNKADVVEPKSLDEILCFTADTIMQLAGEPTPRIYPLSALAPAVRYHDVTTTSLEWLTCDIVEFLHVERNKMFVQSIRQCLSAILVACRTDLAVRIATSAEAPRDTVAKQADFENIAKRAYDAYMRRERSFIEALERLTDLARNEILRNVESKCDLDQQLFFRSIHSRPKPDIVRSLHDFASEQPDSVFEGWFQELENSFFSAASGIAGAFLKSANAIISNFGEQILQQFRLDIKTNDIKAAFTRLPSRERQPAALAEPAIPLAAALIPRRLLEYWATRQVRTIARRRIGLIGQRTIREFTERVQTTTREFTDVVGRALRKEIELVLAGISEAECQRERACSAQNQRLAEQLAHIRKLDDLIASVNAHHEFAPGEVPTEPVAIGNT